MKYVQDLSREKKTMTTKKAKMERQTNKKKRGLKKIGRFSKVTPKNLESDFEWEAKGERSLEMNEDHPSQLRGAPEPSLREPAPSVASTTSVLDHMGKGLTEHDMRLKLEANKDARRERERQRREERPSPLNMTRGIGLTTRGRDVGGPLLIIPANNLGEGKT